MKNREIIYKGIKFYLNENSFRNEFESKYKLLYYNEDRGAWIYLFSADTKKEVLERIRESYKMHYHPWA